MTAWFDRGTGPTGTFPYADEGAPALALASYPQRVPGATLAKAPPASFTPYAPELYKRVANGIRHLDDARVAAPAAETAPAQPPAVPPAVAVLADEPEAAAARWPEGVARGLLIAGLWDAARWYEDLDADSCPECRTDEGLCSWHAPRYVKALEYQELHDLVVNEPSDAAALAAVADACSAATADPGDLGSPGSPLATVLAEALTAVGGAR